MEAFKIFYVSSQQSRLISMLLSADGFFFSSKTCILISHFLLLPSILSSILIVRYWRGSTQHTQNYQLWDFAFRTFRQTVPATKSSGAGDLSQPALRTNSAADNFSPLNQFLILCGSFACCRISHFSGLFLGCHVSFFIFQRGGGVNPFNSQTRCLCLPVPPSYCCP